MNQISEIHPNLYLSGVIYNPASRTWYAELGLKLVISLCEHPINVRDLPLSSGVKRHHIRIKDFPEEDISAHFDYVTELIHNSLATQEGVLVHCHAGVSRSPTFIMAYLMRFQGATLRSAWKWVRECRSSIKPNEGFIHQLIGYEAKLFGGVTTVKMLRIRNTLPWLADGPNRDYVLPDIYLNHEERERIRRYKREIEVIQEEVLVFGVVFRREEALHSAD